LRYLSGREVETFSGLRLSGRCDLPVFSDYTMISEKTYFPIFLILLEVPSIPLSVLFPDKHVILN
jgi:hypothetical protein